MVKFDKIMLFVTVMYSHSIVFTYIMSNEDNVPTPQTTRTNYSEEDKKTLLEIIKFGEEGRFNKVIVQKDTKLNIQKNQTKLSYAKLRINWMTCKRTMFWLN